MKSYLSQQDYVKKVPEKFNMMDAKVVSTPMVNHFKLPAKTKKKIKMSKEPYASGLGCLVYAMEYTRPYLAHTVSTINKVMSTVDYVFTRACKSVYWRSMIQSIIALSTIETEYMTVTKTAKEAL